MFKFKKQTVMKNISNITSKTNLKMKIKVTK